ncbi:MAG: ABC transporter substrate-binding protein [Levilactobacillus brevis]
MNIHGWKKLSVLALTGLAAFSLTACGNKSADGGSAKTTTITFWNGFTASDGANLKKIVADYNKTNKDHVKVKMDQMSWDNFNEKLPTAITARKAPDFVAMNYGDMAGYVHNGTMKDMSDFYNYKGVDKSNFQTSAINMGKIKGKGRLQI